MLVDNAVTRYLAVELAPHGMAANAIAAGAVETNVWRAIPDGEAALEQIRARTPSGSLVSVEAVAEVVAFLAGPAAAAIHGQVLVVDGGYSILA